MIRTIIVPDQRIVHVSFAIPESYVGSEMEIIAFSHDEGLAAELKPDTKATFSALSYNTKGFNFNRDEANER